MQQPCCVFRRDKYTLSESPTLRDSDSPSPSGRTGTVLRTVRPSLLGDSILRTVEPQLFKPPRRSHMRSQRSQPPSLPRSPAVSRSANGTPRDGSKRPMHVALVLHFIVPSTWSGGEEHCCHCIRGRKTVALNPRTHENPPRTCQNPTPRCDGWSRTPAPSRPQSPYRE